MPFMAPLWLNLSVAFRVTLYYILKAGDGEFSSKGM
jgi:hypothetical protein